MTTTKGEEMSERLECAGCGGSGWTGDDGCADCLGTGVVEPLGEGPVSVTTAAAGASLQIDRSVHDPSTAMGKFFFSILATFAEFEADVASQRTKEGLAIARSKGRLNGKPPKLNKRQHMKVLEEFESGATAVGDLAEDYGVDRATIYRTVKRARAMRESP